MNEENLTQAMQEIAADLSGQPVGPDTIIADVLPDNGARDGSNLSNSFYLGTRWTIVKNGGTDKDWPAGWPTLSFAGLATKLLSMLILLLCLTVAAHAQLTVNLNAGKTELGRGAVAFTLAYIRTADSVLGGKERLTYGDHSVFQVTPTFHIQSGTEDAMSSIEAKMTGLLISFKTRKLASGVTIPDFGRTFASFPFSAGVETNDRFSFVNTIAEAGFVPVFTGRNNPAVLRHTTLGFFLQGGYKIKTTDSAFVGAGGDKDASMEALNAAIFRGHGALAVDTKELFNAGLASFGLVAKADVWYDFVNAAIYHRLDGVLRAYFQNGFTIDFIYQHGSGAPLFNDGDQFGLGLTATF